ncbi:NAD(P)/FAD-dependent oxidoreductase [Pullulanibacillus camelliae]|nr:NAD(P)/FAD-dependent oxidoreductase [Pullulanibacillus camelliae]
MNSENHECIIIGGGIAGLQAAIQLGRYQHDVVVIDANDGRSMLCQSYHNVLGWPNGISGQHLREIGQKQAEALGVIFKKEKVINAKKSGNDYMLLTDQGHKYKSSRLLLATGIKDRIPIFSELQPCLGISVYICPDCDGYEIKDRHAIVLGSGNAGAGMALALTYFSEDLVYVNHESEPINEELMAALEEHHILCYHSSIKKVLRSNDQFQGVMLDDGTTLQANHAFVAFGGNQVRSDLARQLGVNLHHNLHIETNGRTKMTNIENIWAAGDVTVHSEQVAIAMGDGLQAAIWIHKSILKERK